MNGQSAGNREFMAFGTQGNEAFIESCKILRG